MTFFNRTVASATVAAAFIALATMASGSQAAPGSIDAGADPRTVNATVSSDAPLAGDESDALLDGQSNEADALTLADVDVSDVAPIEEQVVPPIAASLGELVAAQSVPTNLSPEMDCLAGAVYFETRGEPLIGQLAVAKVVLNRRDSARWPSTVCGVVTQRSQFSFVRGGRIPAANRSSNAWRRAVAIAQIANDDLWQSPADDAYFFHARHVSPRWRLTRVAQIENHIFYR